MCFASVRLVCHERRIAAHLLIWFVARRASTRLVCHDRRICCVVVHGSCQVAGWLVMNLVFVVCLFICSRWLPGDSLVCYGVVQFCHAVVVCVTGWLRRFTLRVWVSRLPGLLGL